MSVILWHFFRSLISLSQFWSKLVFHINIDMNKMHFQYIYITITLIIQIVRGLKYQEITLTRPYILSFNILVSDEFYWIITVTTFHLWLKNCSHGCEEVRCTCTRLYKLCNTLHMWLYTTVDQRPFGSASEIRSIDINASKTFEDWIKGRCLLNFHEILKLPVCVRRWALRWELFVYTFLQPL